MSQRTALAEQRLERPSLFLRYKHDDRELDAAWQELRQGVVAGRSVVAGGVKGQEQAVGAGSSTTASAEDNVVPLPSRHHLRLSQIDGVQAGAAFEKTVLEGLVNMAIRSATRTRALYDKRASHVGKCWNGLRTGAIAFGVLGPLCPLLPASVTSLFASEATISASGFVLFVLAGGCLLLDQVLGLSSAWIHYNVAEFRLGKLIRSFTLEVQAELTKCGGKMVPAARADRILVRLKDFVLEVDKIKIEAKGTWIAEAKADLPQVEPFTKRERKSVHRKGTCLP
jgi:hypothetical protein